ncbi:MAG: hypothetical protein VKS61_00680 [Candidatus Sericytochromatia bacterium]|nr:hypothetical protein [Candidatus Sericytochromatia bacterium]
MGVVAAPGYLLTDAGTRLRPKGDAGVISDRGLGYRLRAADAQPLVGVKVFLADAAGQPVPDIASVRTDAEGRYRLEGVAANAGYVVVAEVPMSTGATGQLRTLAKVGTAGVTAPIGPATTLVTLNVLEGSAGSDLVGVNLANFQSAVDVTARSLTPERVPNFSDRASVKRAIDQLVTEVAELRGILGEIRQALAAIRQQLAALDKKIATGSSPGPATPAGAPSPAASPLQGAPSPGAPVSGPNEASLPTAAPLAGLVSTLAGSGAYGSANGPGAEAQFNIPTSVAVDASGNVYVTEAPPTGQSQSIRKISAQGIVSTLAGSDQMGFADGSGVEARFSWPKNLAVDTSGNVYVADYGNHRIRKITPQGVVTTLAGSGQMGFAEGPGPEAQFSFPSGVAVDASGNVYVADRDNHRILKVTPQGVVTTLAGSGTPGFTDGPGAKAEFWNPVGVAVDASGKVYVADAVNNRIRVIR